MQAAAGASSKRCFGVAICIELPWRADIGWGERAGSPSWNRIDVSLSMVRLLCPSSFWVSPAGQRGIPPQISEESREVLSLPAVRNVNLRSSYILLRLSLVAALSHAGISDSHSVRMRGPYRAGSKRRCSDSACRLRARLASFLIDSCSSSFVPFRTTVPISIRLLVFLTLNPDRLPSA